MRTRSAESSRTGSGRRRTPSSGSSVGWLERISVRRPWRRRGLARAITAESLRRLRDRGMTRGDARRGCGQSARCPRALRGSRIHGGQRSSGVSTGARSRVDSRFGGAGGPAGARRFRRRGGRRRAPSRARPVRAPIVVEPPWPGSTWTPSSRLDRRASEAAISAASPPGRSTRPHPPANSVSPLNSGPRRA